MEIKQFYNGGRDFDSPRLYLREKEMSDFIGLCIPILEESCRSLSSGRETGSGSILESLENNFPELQGESRFISDL